MAKWLAGKALVIPLKLLLYPIKKIARIVRATTGVPKDFAHTYLLARSLHRCLENGMLPNDTSPKNLQRTSKQIRQAYDETFKSMNNSAFKSIAGAIKKEVSHLKPEVIRSILKITGRDLSEDRKQSEAQIMGDAVDPKSKAILSEGSVEDLNFQNFIYQFDQLFDSKLSLQI